MGNEIEIAVIAGLAVGIAFVLLFSFYSPSSRDVVTGTTSSGGITISLEDLKDQYPLSEPLNFTVTAKGRGALCDYPTVKILNAKSGEVAYDFPNLDVVYECSPDPVDHDITWRLGDMMDPCSPVLIGELGHYVLKVELGGVVLKKEFIIYDDALSPSAVNKSGCMSDEQFESSKRFEVAKPSWLPNQYSLQCQSSNTLRATIMYYPKPMSSSDPDIAMRQDGAIIVIVSDETLTERFQMCRVHNRG